MSDITLYHGRKVMIMITVPQAKKMQEGVVFLVVNDLANSLGKSPEDVFRVFLTSETYKCLQDIPSKYYLESPKYIIDMLKEEGVTF